MRDKLPVYIENRELPRDEYMEESKNRNFSYGYVSVLYLASIIITVVSVLTVVYLRK